MEERVYGVKYQDYIVLVHKSGNYTRVTNASKNDINEETEVVLYDKLFSDEARSISMKFNKAHDAIKKKVNRDFLGLLRLLKMRSDYMVETDDMTTVYVFYAWYGIGAFTVSAPPEDAWVTEEIKVPRDMVSEFIQFIKELDDFTKYYIKEEALNGTEKLYKQLLEDRESKQLISLDSIS